MPIDGTWPHVIRVPSCHTIYLYCDRNSLYILSELYCHMIGYISYYSDMSILIIDVTVFHDNKYTLICILSYQSYYTVYYEHKLHSLIL